MVLDAVLAEVGDILSASRWSDPDTPGSARVRELRTRVNDPAALRAFSEAPEGEFLVALLEEFENALNDDWLPFQIAGLPLPEARQFLGRIATVARKQGAPAPLEVVRSIHRELAESVA